MLLWLCLCSTVFIPFSLQAKKTCGDLYITVTAEEQRLQVNWNFTCNPQPDALILYRTGAMRLYDELQKMPIEQGNRYGFIVTNHVLSVEEKNNLPCNWGPNSKRNPCTENCLPYYVKSLQDGDLVDWECLKIEPIWMREFREMRIAEMYIPGQFLAGSTQAMCFTPNLYIFQDLELYESLVYGIRYFHIQVTTEDLFGSEIYIMSSIVTCIPLRTQLERVAMFLKRSKREIVILDFDKFTLFSAAAHDELIQLIKATFGNMIVPRTFDDHKFGPKLKNMWKANKRIIINYRTDWVVKKFDIFWNDLRFKPYKRMNWCKKTGCVSNLISHEAADHSHPEKLCAAALAVYPCMSKLYWHSLRKRTDWVNPYITNWLEETRSVETVNIVAVAFFEGTNIVDQAISENHRRLEYIKPTNGSV